MSKRFLFVNNRSTKLYQSRYPTLQTNSTDSQLCVLLFLNENSNPNLKLNKKKGQK